MGTRIHIDGHLASYLPELRNEEADRTAATRGKDS